MNRLTLWPDFRSDWIVHDDTDLLVVDKPAGVPSQAADPDRPDDVVARLRSYLGGAYLGAHQRLDQDTSGLLVFARRKEANPSLARQFEGRSVKKTYLACVAGWPRGKDRAVLRDAIEPGEGKAMRVALGRSKNAKMAVTSVRVAQRVGERTLLELELETGRTHQARVQLAHAGAPIAGDALYGGPPAPRLLLHAAGLELEHPSTGTPARFAARTPPDFPLWIARGDLAEGIYDDGEALGRAVARAVERRWGLGRADAGERATTAFRLIHEEGDGLPRLAVDVYDRWLVAQFYGDDGPWAEAARRDRVLDLLGALGFDGVYVKVRPKQSNALTREPASRQESLAPPDPVRGAPAPKDVPIVEEGMPLVARLGDGLSTGLFLDQRGNRRRVRDASEGKRVANLFAYTCAFTVAAALGGATHTTSVDVSIAALERGRQNLAAAGFGDRPEHALVADDAFSWLARAARRGEVYDLVILDPPSYSTTKRGRFVADHDYAELAAAALALLRPGGQMLACTNHRGISRSRFRRILFDAGRAAKRVDLRVRDLPEPNDYPAAAGQDSNTKSVWITCA